MLVPGDRARASVAIAPEKSPSVYRFGSRASFSRLPASEHLQATEQYVVSPNRVDRDTRALHGCLARIIAVGSPQVSDEFLVTCPFCGEQLEIYVEPDVNGSFVQDCEVCCNPWRVHVSGRNEDRVVHVTRADGSE